MKKTHYMISITFITIGFISATQAMYRPVLKNQYGEPIEYIELAGDISEYIKEKPRHVFRLEDGEEATITNFITDNHDFLSIRKPNGQFYDVSYKLALLKKEQQKHTGERGTMTIKPGYNPFYWNIPITWQK